MKIEFLFPKRAAFHGDNGNHMLLSKIFDKDEIIETKIDDTPAFINNDVRLMYIGAMTEEFQLKAIEKFMPYREAFIEYIEKGNILIATNNAMEIFFKEIICGEKRDKGLGIFNFTAKSMKPKRHNSFFIGKFNNQNVVGFKTQFTHAYGDNSDNYFIEVERGVGLNPDSKLEGIRKNNFYATYLTGPFLIMNPYFTEYIIETLGVKREIPYLDVMREAYEIRVKDHLDKKTFHF